MLVEAWAQAEVMCGNLGESPVPSIVGADDDDAFGCRSPLWRRHSMELRHSSWSVSLQRKPQIDPALTRPGRFDRHVSFLE